MPATEQSQQPFGSIRSVSLTALFQLPGKTSDKLSSGYHAKRRAKNERFSKVIELQENYLTFTLFNQQKRRRDSLPILKSEVSIPKILTNEKSTEQSVESQNNSTKESINTYEFRSQVTEEINSLREKVDQILKALKVKDDCDPEVIMEEIHRYPTEEQDFVRCAIIGLIRGDEYSRSGQTIITTRVDNIFDNPNTVPEKVAAFVSQLADPARIDVCRRVCQGYQARSELKTICSLTDDALDNAIKPLLEWGFLKWEQREDELSLRERGPGIRFIIPLIFLTQETLRLKEDMPSNWDHSIWTGTNGKPPQKR